MHSLPTIRNNGFTLLESLVGITIFVLVVLVVYQAYANLSKLASAAEVKVTASAILSKEIETIRNLAYEDVGIEGGLPSGVLMQSKTVSLNNDQFLIQLYVRSIDDPFDGTINGNPVDTAPADYKLVDISVTCTNCNPPATLTTTTTVAPRNLEISSGNGALFIRVFDAAGLPVPNAQVTIQNTELSPVISFNEITNSAGELQLVDVPPSEESYEISVTKGGYTTETTYAPGAPGNPNPLKAHATVVGGGVTQVSFQIDRVSTLAVSTINSTCEPIGNIPLRFVGNKPIGSDPTVIKYDEVYQSNGAGELNLSNLEWDTYTITEESGGYYLAGSLPPLPLTLAPGTNDRLLMVLAPATPRAILIDVRDQGSGLPIAQAFVEVTGPGYSQAKYSGEGSYRQTDWSGGSGQDIFLDPTRYFDAWFVDTEFPAGDLRLHNTGTFAPNGWLVSSTFDNGTTTNYYRLTTQPLGQPPETGANAVQIQIASNDDNATWNFLGPDGTANTWYTPADSALHEAHSAARYLRYRVALQTQDTNFTPNLSEIAIGYSSACVPSGQAYFDDIGNGSYTFTITKEGYAPYTENFNVQNGWQKLTIPLAPL